MSSKVIHGALSSYFNQDTQMTPQDSNLRKITCWMLSFKKKLNWKIESTNTKITATAMVADFHEMKD